MKIAFFSTKPHDKNYFDRWNASYNFPITYFQAPLNPKTAVLADGHKAACVFVNDRVDKETLEIFSKIGVQFIALRCAGFNNVDWETARKLGIRLVRVPSYSPEAVAEHAVALILTLNRKTHKAYNRVREGNFSLDRLTGFDLNGKTVGVIGTGAIGSAFAKIMLGFSCKVFAHDLYPSPALEKMGVVYRSFEEILKLSDIISLHCPLNSETHHLINRTAFDQMKEGLMLINTSRGGLIDTEASIHALKRRKLGYLGIDVYEQEEHLFFKDLSESIIQDELILRLMSFPNVLITSHQGFFTREALDNISKITLENLRKLEQNIVVENEIHPSKVRQV